jgi:ribosomal protein S18 acetylase RimI-like enzyme
MRPDVISARPFVVTDADSVRRIMDLCTCELREVYVPRFPVDTSPAGNAISPSRVVAVDRSDAVVGVAESFIRPQTLYVQGVAVDPACRRRGVARKLLAHLILLSAEQGLPELQLVTIKETGNVDIFLRLGLSVIGEQISTRFIGRHGQPVTEVTLRRYVL